MALDEAISRGINSQSWLNVFENTIKRTLMKNFTKCLVEILSRNEDEIVVSDFVEKGMWKVN